ncbi:hypothetical protein ABT144_29565 [Streptomyces sp. NPDC002039]|uniref:hypothetical protein n=1 Tax=Streptomyces sp. NPDC002039 TaxID=3154660 RepID=UPI003333DF7F
MDGSGGCRCCHGVLAGFGMVTYVYVPGMLMPAAMERSLAQFGSLGYVFTLLSSMLGGCCVVVVGIALGQMTAASGPFPRWLGTPVTDGDADRAPDE